MNNAAATTTKLTAVHDWAYYQREQKLFADLRSAEVLLPLMLNTTPKPSELQEESGPMSPLRDDSEAAGTG